MEFPLWLSGLGGSSLLSRGAAIQSGVRMCKVSWGQSGYHGKQLGKDSLERTPPKRTVYLDPKEGSCG